MWRINKEFIDNQWKTGKDFFFSHDPTQATGFFKKEVDYMQNVLKVRDFKKIGVDLWQAIK